MQSITVQMSLLYSHYSSVSLKNSPKLSFHCASWGFTLSRYNVGVQR